MNLKLTRISQGLTQEQLRQRAKVGLSTIVKLERGDIDGIRVGTLKKIASALGKDVVELFFS